ncbi:M3 family metallopeptidase [Undibacterium arcticum]|uniref:M3 family metallopeptidase n=1 Tax=Undibacterium arcticum TaxID=1762892 RepID=A0ABV7EVR9_9BURK
MKPSSLFLSVSAALISLTTGPAIGQTTERPLIPILRAGEISARCDLGLVGLRKQVAALEQMPAAKAHHAKTVFAVWNQLQMAIEDLQGPVDLLSNVSPDAKVRSESEPCLVDINKFATELLQNRTLYRRFKSIKGDAIETKLRQDVLDGFDDAGVSLPPEKRVRMKAIVVRLEMLGQEFARNVRDNNQKLSFSADEVKGLPADYLAKAKRDDQGNYLLGFEYPEYNPFMEYADSSEARERFQFAYANHGTPKNLPLLKEAMALRREMAALFALPSYADFVVRRRMASTPATVNTFLGEVQQAVTSSEQKEIEELRAYKAQTLNTPLADTKLNRWDVAYWQQKLKQSRYNVDQNALRKYFPTDAAVPWILDVSSKLYGIEFKPAEVPVWHADVKYYDVFNAANHQRIGGIYLDLFPREGKYGHAAAWPVRGVSTVAGRTPISALVTNFDRVGLSGDELETLVHEFGHVLHGVLSHTRYVSQSGTSVERDFVEAPSQMYEEWARRKESLQLMAGFCKPGCPEIDDQILQRMTAAHNYGRGIRYARQLLYARYDMALHNGTSDDPLVVWQKMEGATPLGYVAGTEFPGQFGHLMGGYAAGYYGYMWSEVLALDMLSRYHGKLMNPEVGQLYRKSILERGSELRGADLVRGFLGRESNSKAFFDEIAGHRLQ